MAAWRAAISTPSRKGLKEIVDEDYLAYRLRTSAYIAERLEALGVPTVKPSGGHAIFVNAKKFLPHIPPLEYPGPVAGGGAVHRRRHPLLRDRHRDVRPHPDGSEHPAPMELVRLALPRRVYTQSHADYIVEVFETIAAQQGQAARHAHRLAARTHAAFLGEVRAAFSKTACSAPSARARPRSS
jgi:tryptophanase